MSTRSQIGFYEEKEQDLQNFQALIYRHSDGYPGKPDGSEYGVLAEIIPFLKQFSRSSDTEYCSARLLQYLTNLHDKIGLEWIKTKGYTHMESQFGLTGSLGYGICKAFQGDIEYFYAVKGGKSVQVYEIGWDGDYLNPKNWKLIETIELQQELVK